MLGLKTETMDNGVLTDDMIARMFQAGDISGPAPVDGQIQPSSVDLRLGRRGWRMKASFLPGIAPVSERIAELAMCEIDIAAGAVLETDAVYLIEISEGLDLDAEVEAIANPKSSTGRLDVFVRLICEGTDYFDTIPPGYSGRMWLEVVPKTFPVRVREGSRLTQIRFRRNADLARPLTDRALERAHENSQLISGGAPIFRNGLCVGIDLEGDADGVVGWRARRNAGIVDVDVVGACDREEFWEPVRRRPTGGLVLEPGEFYILVSSQEVKVPPHLAAEMLPYDAGMGEFRVHYAGFFDPGFGYGDGNASRAVLEVRARDVPFHLRHGQTVATLRYELMAHKPSKLYGGGIGSNYQGQGLKLSKHFR